jgi:prepilin-type N-terminal cleavage/methylation domain-containing protein
MLKRLNNKKGVTLTELIVAMLVMSIIMLSVTSVFMPMYNAYVHANDMAEINNLHNALSSVIMNDIENAWDIGWVGGTRTLSIATRVNAAPNVIYTIDNGRLMRNGSEVFDERFYRRNAVNIGYRRDGDIAYVMLTVNGYNREYAARPVGLQ